MAPISMEWIGSVLSHTELSYSRVDLINRNKNNTTNDINMNNNYNGGVDWLIIIQQSIINLSSISYMMTSCLNEWCRVEMNLS